MSLNEWHLIVGGLVALVVVLAFLTRVVGLMLAIRWQASDDLKTRSIFWSKDWIRRSRSWKRP